MRRIKEHFLQSVRADAERAERENKKEKDAMKNKIMLITYADSFGNLLIKICSFVLKISGQEERRRRSR